MNKNVQELYEISYKILLKDTEDPSKQRNGPGFMIVAILKNS